MPLEQGRRMLVAFDALGSTQGLPLVTSTQGLPLVTIVPLIVSAAPFVIGTNHMPPTTSVIGAMFCGRKTAARILNEASR
jgi:hypothetical protein